MKQPGSSETTTRVFVDGTLISSEGSGVATRLRGLLNHYEGRFEITVLVDARAPIPRAWFRDSIRILAIEPPRTPWDRLLRGGRTFEKQLLEKFPALPQAAPYLFLSEGLPPPRLKYGRTLATVHDLRFLHPSLVSWGRFVMGKTVVNARLRACDGIITVSESMKSELVQQGFRAEQIRVIPGGVLASKPEDEVSSPDSYSMVVLGHLEKRKNPEVALKGFASFLKCVEEPWTLSFVGRDSGMYTSGLTQMARRLGVENRVRFFKGLNDREVQRLLSRSSLALLPSLYEGFGLVALESQRLGVPVVASRIPAHQEVLGESALFFDPREPWDLARVLIDAVHRERNEFVSKGLANIARFGWRDSALALDAVLHEFGAGGEKGSRSRESQQQG